MTAVAGWLRQAEDADGRMLSAGGSWNVDNAGRLDADLHALAPIVEGRLRIDLADVELLDTAGAWLLHRTVTELRQAGTAVAIIGATPEQAALLRQVADDYRPCEIEPPRPTAIVEVVAEVGKSTLWVIREAADLLSFFGETLVALIRTLGHPRRLRLTSMVFHMQQVGFNALPIVGLISFLIGVVLAYQGAQQLQRFGAEIFVVNLVSISVLREIGILLTAIVVAGRSGSAFAAQIGSMKVHEEIDAMRTLGLDPIEVLVLPRILALVLTLPLLAFFADLMGLLGGGLMAWVVLDIGPDVYLDRLKDATSIWSFWVGIIKAPVFAFLIALIGCYEGMQVAGSAESVGRQTTRAVVEAIFLVIIADAGFSIFFGLVGV